MGRRGCNALKGTTKSRGFAAGCSASSQAKWRPPLPHARLFPASLRSLPVILLVLAGVDLGALSEVLLAAARVVVIAGAVVSVVLHGGERVKE